MISVESFAGDTAKLYNPAAIVKKDVAAAVAKAKKEGKHVLITRPICKGSLVNR